MAVYVDKLRTYSDEWYSNDQAARNGRRHGHRWCHLWADSEAELHAFAAKLGLRRAWAHRRRNGDVHYDLVPTKRVKAVQLGALIVER
jgi:hypothetical protein